MDCSFNYTCACPPGRHGERCQCKIAICNSGIFSEMKYFLAILVSKVAQISAVVFNLAIPGFSIQQFEKKTDYHFYKHSEISIGHLAPFCKLIFEKIHN